MAGQNPSPFSAQADRIKDMLVGIPDYAKTVLDCRFVHVVVRVRDNSQLYLG